MSPIGARTPETPSPTDAVKSERADRAIECGGATISNARPEPISRHVTRRDAEAMRRTRRAFAMWALKRSLSSRRGIR